MNIKSRLMKGRARRSVRACGGERPREANRLTHPGPLPLSACVATPSPLNGERAGVRGENVFSRPFAQLSLFGLLFLLPLHLFPADTAALRSALTFHASFDGGVDADFGLGDRKFYNAPSMNKRADATAGLPTNTFVVTARDKGRWGDALHFKDKSATTVFFHAAKNVAYRQTNWSGTVSFWLSADPPGELKPGFCDPIQITPRAWNDAAFFVEFEKRPAGIPFRLGAYADFKVWNPTNRKWEDIPMADKPLLTVDNPPFAKSKWTHVAFTFEKFNTSAADGVARLYLDGQLRGTLSARTQTFTWDVEKSAIMLGLSYVGLYDELSLFNRALSSEEIGQLHGLEGGVKGLLK